jgi:hypothetical protein
LVGIPSAYNGGGDGFYEGRSGYYGYRPYWHRHYWHPHAYYGRDHHDW